MMKAAMRMQKHQLPSLLRYTADGSFKKSAYLAAGYTNYDVLVVGAGAGRTGYHTYSTTYKAYSSGGGGGGAIRFSGLLTDLYENCGIEVGEAGLHGAGLVSGPGSGPPYTAGNGSSGGFSYFSAPGGLRIATGGDAGSAGGWGGTLHDQYLGIAGGYGGTGGIDIVTNSNGNAIRGTNNEFSAVAPTSGLWDNVTFIGDGGAGGAGLYAQVGPTVSRAAQAGSAGCEFAGNAYVSAGGAVVPTSQGGFGGGINIAPITGGAAEYWGSHRAGSNPGGIVIVKLS